MKSHCDIVLINPGGRSEAYQDLSNDLAAIEPPLWLALVGRYLQQKSWAVEIIDADAEALTASQVAQRVGEASPILAVIFAYGANPSASTQKMPVVRLIAQQIKDSLPALPLALGGVHVSALPERTLTEEPCDFAIQGEGFRTLDALLACLQAGGQELEKVAGLWFRRDGQVTHTPPAPLLKDLDADLDGGAWDLLPMAGYRAHNWHCFDRLDRRSPYAAIYTSFGCPFNCSFCCINAPFGGSGIRYRGVASVLAEIDLLVSRYGVTNIKIADELFVLKPERVRAICQGLIERNYGLNIWAYARVDTVAPDLLDKLKQAGVNWLAYGFESAVASVRLEASKRFEDETVERAIALTRQAGIYIIANYIFGLPEDDYHTMAATLQAAMVHDFEFANFYCAMAYPGSRLYEQAIKEHWALPEAWAGYSQLGYETLPLPTKHLSAQQVLNFRDRAFVKFFADRSYQERIERQFGPEAKRHIQQMLAVNIRRRHAESTEIR